MNKLIRGLGLALVVAGMLGLSGCSADNESEAARAQPIGDATVKPDADFTKQEGAKSQAEWYSRKGDPYQTKNYPSSSKPKSK